MSHSRVISIFSRGRLISVYLRSYLDLGKEEVDHALAIHGKSIVIDASIVPFINYVGEDIWIDDVLKGGVTAGNATVCMQRSFAEAMREIAEYRDWAEKKQEKALFVRNASDIERAKRDVKHGIILGPQDSIFVERNFEFLNIAHLMGLRIMQLTYNLRNEAGDGCVERCDAGLSNFGVGLVEEMNRLGILIDLSHTGDRSSMEAV